MRELWWVGCVNWWVGCINVPWETPLVWGMGLW